jgi:hypothetical protein
MKETNTRTTFRVKGQQLAYTWYAFHTLCSSKIFTRVVRIRLPKRSIVLFPTRLNTPYNKEK